MDDPHRKGRQVALPPSVVGVMYLSEEILVVVGGKIILCTGFTAEGFAVANFLQVVQATGNTFIAVTVESVEIDARSAIYTAVVLSAVNILGII